MHILCSHIFHHMEIIIWFYERFIEQKFQLQSLTRFLFIFRLKNDDYLNYFGSSNNNHFLLASTEKTSIVD